MAVSGDGPPPFVPFGQGLQTGGDSKGRSSDSTKGDYYSNIEKKFHFFEQQTLLYFLPQELDSTQVGRECENEKKERIVYFLCSRLLPPCACCGFYFHTRLMISREREREREKEVSVMFYMWGVPGK